MATVGDQIKEPEAGWRRYDDTHPGLKYTGTWTTPSPTNAGYYGGSIRVTSRAVDNNYVTFSFLGTKLRIISDFYSDRHSDNAITIDGVTETYSAFRAVGTSSLQQAIVYEKLGLNLGFHTVSIATGHNRINFTLDAIDIDETGYLYGYTLTAPEAGWKRIDDSSPQVAVSGNIARNTTDSNFHNTSAIFIQDATGQINFKFYGTKFRLIGAKNTNRSTNIEVFINDVKGTSFSQNGTLLYKSMDYEKSGLPLGTYTVTIKGNGVYGLDAIDIDDYGYLVAQIGQQLVSPEPGWRRYDDSHSAIVYIGTNWIFQTQTGTSTLYNSTHHYSAQGKGDNEVRFKFYGTKFRLISSTGTNFADDMSVEIDGVTEKFSTKIPSATDQRQRLTYERKNLSLGVHEVRLASGTNGDWRLDVDAVDIDSDGRLFHPDEVSNVADLEVGKRIRCNYQSSTANTVGVFSGLGEQTSDFIPVTSSTTPNGDFYFIMVENRNGRKLLVADRNIQNGVSWDTINISGMVSGVLVSLTELKEMSTSIRLLTGGINASDKDNEWDRYIVNSTLNGKVTAGDNNVWNYNGGASWTSTTNAAGSANRTGRGANGNAGASGYNPSAYIAAATATGFRPVMEVVVLPMYRSFISHDGSYKKWNAGWSVVSPTLPSENTFIGEGISDLSVLDRKSTNFNQTMTLNGNLGSGEVFKSTVNLKKYIEITSLSVK
ncbi:hypothetical protein SAMN05720606_10891 [Paenibacillus polysaccharolyticus]|uniref:Uncharacterized protein n=2 Tax=Paenibacillus polysaccharolyticus TaxID=582692 RepID=A0A1G5I9X4_9BACL|nr:hypothetical protein SAMN05720606_10891 [Paenibacillus polysaccharolyticus]